MKQEQEIDKTIKDKSLDKNEHLKSTDKKEIKNHKDKEHLNKVRHRSIELFSEKMVLKNALKKINIQKDEIEIKNVDLQHKNEEILTQQEHLVKANEEIKEKNEKLNKAVEKARRKTKIVFGKHIDLKKAKKYISIINEDIERKNAKLEKAILKARKRTIDLFGKHIDLKKAKKRIELQGELLQDSYNELEIKNIQINDSLDYAKHIQRAILPPIDRIRANFPKSFIFFQPKDIVSGDFYWLAEKNHNVYMAIIDCTGHGVPGAFMSMIGNTILNQIIHDKPQIQPSDFLLSLNNEIHSAFYRNQSDSDFQNDGMDLTICKYDKTSGKITVSSAGQNFAIIKNGNLNVYRGNMFGIGELLDDDYVLEFMEVSEVLDDNIRLYMFTDGFPDQFGGEKNKKFHQKRLLDIIVNNQSLSMPEQKNLLEKTFIEWKGEEMQIDDVLLMGINFDVP